MARRGDWCGRGLWSGCFAWPARLQHCRPATLGGARLADRRGASAAESERSRRATSASSSTAGDVAVRTRRGCSVLSGDRSDRGARRRCSKRELDRGFAGNAWKTAPGYGGSKIAGWWPGQGASLVMYVLGRRKLGRCSGLRHLAQRSEGITEHVHPRRREHQGHLPGPDRLAGHLPLRAGDRLRHEDGRRRHPREGRRDPHRPAGLQHRRRGEGEDRRHRDGDLRAAALRGRRDPRGDRRRARAHRLHHRGHPGARHDEGQARARRARSRS